MKRFYIKTLALLLSAVLLFGLLPAAGAAEPAITEPDFAGLVQTAAQERVPGVILLTDAIYYAGWINRFHGAWAAYQDAVSGNLGVVDFAGRVCWQPNDPSIIMIEPFANGIAMAMHEGSGWKPYTVYGEQLGGQDFQTGEFSGNYDWATGEQRYVTGELRTENMDEPAGRFVIDGAGHCLTAEDLGLVYRGTLPLKRNGKWGLCDMEQTELLPFVYDELRFVDADTLLAKQDGAYRLIDRSGATVAELPGCTEAESVAPYEAYILVKENGLWGVRNAAGELTLDCRCTELRFVIYGQSPDYRVMLYGLVGEEWRFLSPDGRIDACYAKEGDDLNFHLASYLRDDLLALRDGNIWRITDGKGRELIPGSYRDYQERGGWLLLEELPQDRTAAISYAVYDPSLHLVASLEDVSGAFLTEEAYCWLKDGTLHVVSMADGSERQAENISGWDYPYNNVCGFIAESGGRYALFDALGNRCTDFRYTAAGMTYINGLFFGQRDGKWYVLDCRGNEVTPPLDTQINFTTEGDSDYAAYQSGGKCGFLKYRRAEDPLFADIQASDWFAEGADFCAATGLMKGVGGGKFAPQTVTTRAMLVQVLYNLSGEKCAAHGFADVPANAWYADAVNWAAANGIVNGVSDTRFAPDDPVTREQMVTILRRYAQHFGAQDGAADALDAFADAGSASDYALDALRWAVTVGLVNGTSATQLSPQGSATRAQIATILMRFVRLMAAR